MQIAQPGPILVSCLKDIGSASVTGSAECLPALLKMVGDFSRAKQALPTEFTSAAAQALRGHLVDFGRKMQAKSRCGPDLMEMQKLHRSVIDLFPECDALAEDIVEKLETTDFQCRLDALQQTMNVFGTSFQGAGAAEKIATLEAASDSVSAAGAKVSEGVINTSAWASSSASGRRHLKYLLPDDAAQASFELARCATTG